MKALVLGGSGFIGSHVVDRLLLDGVDVTVMDRERERFRPPLPDVAFVQGDFASKDLVEKAIGGMDMVFHLVSTTVPQSANDDPAFDVATNLVASVQLFQTCARQGVGKVIFLSSGGTVYGRPSRVPVAESHPTRPEASYGMTKLAIENYLDLFHRLHGLDYAVVRASNPYGPRQNPDGKQGAIAVFLGSMLREKNIVVWGDGQVIRDYFAVEDLAEGIFQAAVRPTPSRTYNMGSGVGLSINELLDKLKATTGRASHISYQPARPVDVPAMVLDCSLAARELQWRARTPLEEGLQRMWQFVSGWAHDDSLVGAVRDVAEPRR